MYRQGDILLVPLATPPKGQIDATWDGVLARGEATGHAHRVIGGDARIIRDGETISLVIGSEGGQFVHEEHGTVPLAVRSYAVIRQRVYEPERIRLVTD